MIKINNETIPTPSTYNVGISDISKTDRNANGQMIIERVATKREVELGYHYLSEADLAGLLQKIDDVFFTIDYPDPQTGNLNTGTFYVENRSAGAMDYLNGNIRWKEIQFSFTER